MVTDPLAAGNAVVFHLLENVEPFITAGDSIGQHLAGQVGDVDAVAGIALGMEDVLSNRSCSGVAGNQSSNFSFQHKELPILLDSRVRGNDEAAKLTAYFEETGFPRTRE